MPLSTRTHTTDAGTSKPTLHMSTRSLFYSPTAESMAATSAMVAGLSARTPRTPHNTPSSGKPTLTRSPFSRQILEPALGSYSEMKTPPLSEGLRRHSFFAVPATEAASPASDRSASPTAWEIGNELRASRDMGFVVELETIMEGLEERASEEGKSGMGRRRSRIEVGLTI
ncbi:MAG: hypothetical protein M1828_007550 [Chrysothrix sp. TS-e1954]|nr:MAG: hypothetical protein M1828_007550 [Chrysothrix sp. TS-e1954]